MMCHYCRGVMTLPKGAHCKPSTRSRDHITPKRFVPPRERSQMPTVLCCVACNQLRSDAPYEVFRAYMDRCYTMGRQANTKGFAIFRYLLLMAGLRAVMKDARERRTESI